MLIILMIYSNNDTQVGRTALHWAVIKGHCGCVQLLIQAGADVDIKDIVSTLDVHTVYHHDHSHNTSYITDKQNGCSALHDAVSRGHDDCAKLLIQAGADVDIKDNVSTLLVEIVYHNNILITML